MGPRILLYTGKGGVGKTSIAASTACSLARNNKKTLVISTDPAHSLGDAFGTDIGPKPRKMGENLYAQEISVNEAINTHWNELKGYLTGLFQTEGLDPISAEEIATLPGFDEASQLLYLRQYYDEKEYDAIVIDSAPTGESLKLLSFPEAMTWYMDKIFPMGRLAAKLVRPVWNTVSNLSIPDDEVFKSVESLYEYLKKIRAILTDPKISTIRLVMNPDKMSLSETKRAFTYLLLYGYPVDAVFVNKIYDESTGVFFKGWRSNQGEIIKEVSDSFTDLKIFKVPMLKEEPIGIDKLERMSELVYGDSSPLETFSKDKSIQFIKEDGKYLVRLKLPFADKKNLEIFNKGGELIIRLGNWKRVFYLPTVYSDKNPVKAEFNNGVLDIEME
ncbi:MAG: ArsA family ATPase [Thermoplasmatales archaeon]|nr:ArsA family ATPase [Candidatus Thermoplasmatota archaeon]MCL6002225.1 ArsA family ATPase [Candidatus Thermoplasmatota archaeon]MDA8055480.1 ArsA family ATPase [Thermoplasmatales archaeon]